MFALTLEEFSLPVHNGSDEPWLAFNREAYLKAIDALPAEVTARFARGNTSVQNQDCITNEDLDREVAELEAQLALETEPQ